MLNDVHKQLKDYIERYPEEVDELKPLTIQLEGEPEGIFDRKSLPGHITSSAIVLNNNDILMMYHKKLKRWLQPGGHVDPGELPIDAAIRELKEETNMSSTLTDYDRKDVSILDIDVHKIPENKIKGEPEHLHYDIRYKIEVETEEISQNEEDNLVSWMDIQKVKDVNIVRAIEKALKH